MTRSNSRPLATVAGTSWTRWSSSSPRSASSRPCATPRAASAAATTSRPASAVITPVEPASPARATRRSATQSATDRPATGVTVNRPGLSRTEVGGVRPTDAIRRARTRERTSPEMASLAREASRASAPRASSSAPPGHGRGAPARPADRSPARPPGPTAASRLPPEQPAAQRGRAYSPGPIPRMDDSAMAGGRR